MGARHGALCASATGVAVGVLLVTWVKVRYRGVVSQKRHRVRMA